MSSRSLSGDAIVIFMRALCAVSQEELLPANPDEPARYAQLAQLTCLVCVLAVYRPQTGTCCKRCATSVKRSSCWLFS